MAKQRRSWQKIESIEGLILTTGDVSHEFCKQYSPLDTN